MQPKPVRAFARGLELLAALNRHGAAGALALARETGIPRPTVYRLLETLCAAGFVGRSPSDDRFVLRPRVRILADGFEDEDWVRAVAAPALFALTERIGWPSDLATREGTRMVIRETTHRRARFSIDRGMAGRALPLLESSVGRAWLAFAPRADRAAVLRLLGAAGDVDAAAVARLVAATRRRGFGLRPGGAGPWPHTGSIALPIRAADGGVLGCINAIWMARAVTDATGVALCLGPLREAAAAIEAGLAAVAPGRGAT